MNPAARLANALRSLASFGSAKLVRDDDAARVERHGASIPELNAGARSFADEVEQKALRAHKLL